MPLSGATRLQSLPKRKADFIEPMDRAPVPNLPDGSNWAYEIKLDGYRAVAVESDRGVDLFSRRHKSIINTRALSRPLASYRKARLLTVKSSS